MYIIFSYGINHELYCYPIVLLIILTDSCSFGARCHVHSVMKQIMYFNV